MPVCPNGDVYLWKEPTIGHWSGLTSHRTDRHITNTWIQFTTLSLWPYIWISLSRLVCYIHTCIPYTLTIDTYVCTYCIHTRMYVCTLCRRTHTPQVYCTLIRTYFEYCIYVHIYTQIHTYVHKRMHTCIHRCVSKKVHTYLDSI